MSAHRRHFLFHTGGDVTWKHTQKMTCSRYLTCAKYNLLYRCELREPSPNLLLNSEQQLSLFQAFVMQTYSKTLSCLLMTELSVPALGTSPLPFPASVA